MSKVSSEFGKLIKDYLVAQNLTFRSAGLRSSISAAYWKDMADGRVPSEDVLRKIAAAFDDLDENDLRIAAGYAPDSGNMDAVKAVEIALRSQKNLSDIGKQQILDFVRRTEQTYRKQD